MKLRKILIVEDDQKIADTLKLGLTEIGFQVEVAYDGLTGYKLFRSHPQENKPYPQRIPAA